MSDDTPPTRRAQSFWLVWNPHGSTPPRCRHDSIESATLEAERLAREHRGDHFFVLEAKAERFVDDMVRVELGDEKDVPNDIPF